MELEELTKQCNVVTYTGGNCAICITHVPTGTVVKVNYKPGQSQFKARTAAYSKLLEKVNRQSSSAVGEQK